LDDEDLDCSMEPENLIDRMFNPLQQPRAALAEVLSPGDVIVQTEEDLGREKRRKTMKKPYDDNYKSLWRSQNFFCIFTICNAQVFIVGLLLRSDRYFSLQQSRTVTRYE
jgi:hypothetical protein